MANQNFNWNAVLDQLTRAWREDWNVAEEENETSQPQPKPELHETPSPGQAYVYGGSLGLWKNEPAKNFAPNSEATSTLRDGEETHRFNLWKTARTLLNDHYSGPNYHPGEILALARYLDGDLDGE